MVNTQLLPAHGEKSDAGLTEVNVTIGTILLVLLVLMLVGALPTWNHSSRWGYGPSGGIGLLALILIILLVSGRI